MLEEAKSGHTAGSLGMTDIFTYLYFEHLNINVNNIQTNERDYLILSNGHICPVQYATLAEKNIIGKEQLLTFRKINTKLQGHPHRGTIPGLETTSGPLGSGLSQACGIALSLKNDEKNNKVVCCTSDGEHGEGNHWEAVLFANKYKLQNLTVIVDRNNIQIDGKTEDVMPLNKLKDKYESFGWHSQEVNGHDFKQIHKAIKKATKTKKPSVIIAMTTPGKGVSFTENDYTWHGKPPSEKQAIQAFKELNKEQERIQNE